MKLRLIVTVLFIAAITGGCPSIQQGGSTTQPVTNSEAVAAAMRQYNYWLDVAEQWAKIAQGPNPSEESIRKYNEAVWFAEAVRASLAVMGVMVPESTRPTPRMIVRHA